MATHKSALKRVKQSEKKRQRNKAALSVMKTLIKKVHTSVEGKDPKEAGEHLKAATSYIDKIADKKLIHKNKAGRIVSRLTAKVSRTSK